MNKAVFQHKLNGLWRDCTPRAVAPKVWTTKSFRSWLNNDALWTQYASGTVECGAAVSAFLNHMGNFAHGNAIIDPGRYRCDLTIELDDPNDLHVYAVGAELFWPTPDGGMTDPNDWLHRRHVRQWYGSCEVYGLKIRGAQPNTGLNYNAELAFQHSWASEGGNVVLWGVDFGNVWGDFLYVSAPRERVEGVPGGWVYTHSTRVLVTASRFVRNGRQGIGVTGGHNTTIFNNYFERVTRSCLDIEPGSGYDTIEHQWMLDNEYVNCLGNFFTSAGGDTIIDDVRVLRNVKRSTNPNSNLIGCIKIHIAGQDAVDGLKCKRNFEFGWNTGNTPQDGGNFILTAGTMHLSIHDNTSPYEIQQGGAGAPEILASCTPFPGHAILENNDFDGYWTDGILSHNPQWPPT